MLKPEQENCVTINVFVSCDKCDKKDKQERCYEPCYSEKDDKKDNRVNSCVDINVFVECDKKDKK